MSIKGKAGRFNLQVLHSNDLPDNPRVTLSRNGKSASLPLKDLRTYIRLSNSMTPLVLKTLSEILHDATPEEKRYIFGCCKRIMKDYRQVITIKHMSDHLKQHSPLFAPASFEDA